MTDTFPQKSLMFIIQNLTTGKFELRNNFFFTVNDGWLTCGWRADHEILIHDSKSNSELIFVSARQLVLIRDNSLVRKNYLTVCLNATVMHLKEID